MRKIIVPDNLDEWNEFGKDYLPGHLGIEILLVEHDELHARMEILQNTCAPNGFLHAASVVGLADTACGYATINSLPDGATGFTTVELKTNFLGTFLEGHLHCIAKRKHRGRTTQVWDAEVSAGKAGKVIALFRCTQMILYPKPESHRSK